jgi:hypothetical protein
LVDPESARGWVLIDDGMARRFGAALAWAWQHGVQELHVLVEGPAAGVVARRASQMAVPPTVWEARGRSLTPAMAAAPLLEPDPGPNTAFAALLRRLGATPVIEQGVLRGEVLGLEVARVIDGRLEIGVGRHDRAARAELDGDPGPALAEAVATVARLRQPGAAVHPANTLARSRWLRAVVCAQPALAGAASLEPVSPPLPAIDLTDNSAVPCIGVTPDGAPLVVVCSTGIDPDLIPTAADCRLLHQPDAGLVVVIPEGDDHPLTVALAGALARPAILRAVPRGWESLGPGGPASPPRPASPLSTNT